MEWKEWIGKNVFVKTRTSGVYSGKVLDVDDTTPLIVFFTLLDKYNKRVTFVTSEIIKIVEEEER